MNECKCTTVYKEFYKGKEIEILFHTAVHGGLCEENSFVAYIHGFKNFSSKIFDSLLHETKFKIDEWYISEPKTKDEWVSAFSTHVVKQTGYEDWEISETELFHYLDLYAETKKVGDL